jgi:hypothetical protein
VLGKKDKHANRPGKGRRSQRKAKNFQGVWYPPAEHNVSVGTVTSDLCQAEREQRLAKKVSKWLPDTRPKISVERRRVNPITISKPDDDPPRPPGWIPLELKPELVRLSEQGERRLADKKMDDWAQDQVEYEERQRVAIEQKRAEIEREQGIQANRKREEEEAKAAQLKEQEHQREIHQQAQEEKARRARLSVDEAEHEKAERELRAAPTEVETRLEESARHVEELKQEFTRRKVEEESRQAQLSEEERRSEHRTLAKMAAFGEEVLMPEQQISWRVYQERSDRLRREQQEERKRQAEEEERRAEEKRQTALRQAAETRARREEESRRKREEILREREAQRRKAEERHLRATERGVQLIRATEGVSRFQFQVMTLRGQIPEEIESWRERITWRHAGGKAIRIDPPLPPPERDEDLQQVRIAIWEKEMLTHREEDEIEQQEQDALAAARESLRSRWTHLVRVSEEKSRFKSQITMLWGQILEEIKDWRKRITWKYEK